MKPDELTFGLVVHDLEEDLVGRVHLVTATEVILQRPSGRQWAAKPEALKPATAEQKRVLRS
ncbi:hypothetical protein ACFVXC_28195 [Streptomyces sp. NPDC058257]|uniref:hypothetical protein n=1 Tax=Streptomyces sp. NPDC058257 TaxID=3346409 RepID=UPI0036E8E955